jgi:DNA-binding Xre family transcriptional regulator
MAKKFSVLYDRMSPDRKARVEKRVAETLATLPLDKMRKARELTQSELAARMKIAQSEVSKIESRSDMYLSTLREYVESLGGHLVLRAEFPEGEINIAVEHQH